MAGLTPKHHKALSLIEENSGLSVAEIAKAAGFNTSYLYKLMEADPTCGPVGQLFKTALNKVYDNIGKRAKKNAKRTQDVLIKKLRKWAEKLPADKMNENHVKKACDILHALSKATPKIEIGHISITKHLSTEEIVNEYKRLTTLAQYALDGVGIQGTPKGRTRELHRALASGDLLPEIPETDVLSSESEAGDVSQVDDTD
jgi:hypothetical protein